MTEAEELLICRNANKQNEIDAASAYMGTPPLVHFEKILGASPFMDIPCKVRVAENRSPLPALNTEVMIRALTRSASPEMFNRSMAITYGDLLLSASIIQYKIFETHAAPVPFPVVSPPSTAASVGSLDGITMPIHNAEPQKKIKIRQTKDRKALGRILRGFSDSAATIDTYSGPHILCYQRFIFQESLVYQLTRK